MVLGIYFINVSFFLASGGIKGQNVMFRMANPQGAAAVSTQQQTIRIVQVGNQPRKTVAIMPAATTTTSSSSMMKVVTEESSGVKLKRKLAEVEAAARKSREAYEQQLEEAKRLKLKLEQNSGSSSDEA
jgi:hypothetical protein